MDGQTQLVALPRLARHLGVPASWLRVEADAGRLPAIRAGSQRLFNLEVVERILAERAAQPQVPGARGPRHRCSSTDGVSSQADGGAS